MIEHQTFTPLLLQKSDMMDRNIIICNGTSECLLHNIEDYIKFISQVLHDETFLMELNKTMPFDKMVNATKNMGTHNGAIKKNGHLRYENGHRTIFVFPCYNAYV